MDQSTDEEYSYKVGNMILSSTQHVRHVFKLRWKALRKEDWVDDQNYIRKFLEGPGKRVFTKAKLHQKNKLLKSCSVKDWDISLLHHALKYIGNTKKYWNENEAVRRLKIVRNEREHRTSEEFSQSEYNEKMKTLTECLACLGMGKGEIETLVRRASVISPLKAYEHVKLLFEEAERLTRDGNNDAALQKYSEAISTPNLLPVNLGETYERRAESYLKSITSLIDENDKNCERALCDVDKALELNTVSWTANYLAARCHRIKNNLLEAMKSYEAALLISSAQKQVEDDLESCKVLVGVQPKYDELRPRLTALKQGNLDDSLWRGHQCRYGIDVDQDYTRAVAFYTKADKQGNVEASYHLAECHYFGYGVQQNVNKAFEIFKRVAELETSAKNKEKMINKRRIVSEAQFAIGLCYENGTGVEKDNAKAAIWYEKAMENGVGRAANNLGILHFNGFGVTKDERTAEKCWKKGVDLGDGNSAECLVGYYCNQLEPEMAWQFFELGRELKNQRLILLPDEEFKRKVKLVKVEREGMQNEVTEFEKRHQLKSTSLTLKQRVNRTDSQLKKPIIKDPLANKVPVKNIPLAKYCENWEDSYQPLTAKMITKLSQKEKDGSVEALRILQLTEINSELTRMLENTKEFFRGDQLKAVSLLYDCATTAFHFFVFKSDENKRKMENIVLKLFEQTRGQSEKDQMKIRYCYLRVNSWKSVTSEEDECFLDILKDGLKQYPDNHHYYELLLLVLGYRSLWSEGFALSDEALIRFPENSEIMYYRAAHLRYKGEDNLAVIEAYTKFVNNAPPEHRKVAEAYYQISYGYVKEFEKRGDNDIIKLVESNFEKGQESEIVQLPCYLPYQESDAKANVIRFLEKRCKKKSQPKLEMGDATLQKKCSVDKKEYLQSSTREKHIKNHRKMINQSKKGLAIKTDSFANKSKLQQFLPKRSSLVKPVSLCKMKCTEDTIFENRVIDLTIIDDPLSQNKSVCLLVEDENKDTAPLYLCNVEATPKYLEEFQVGCRIAIVNPCMLFNDHTKSFAFRVDQPLCIVHLEKLENICRLCGKQNSTQKCSLCKRPYCSKECRDMDAKKFEHKLICSISN